MSRWIVLVLAAACQSGGVGTPDCSAFTACGGDVAGSWQFLGSCNLASLYPSCPGLRYDPSGYQAALSFNSDGTATETFSGTARISFPLSCFGVDGGVSGSCAAMNRPPMETCTQTSSSCECTANLSQLSAPSARINWATSGTTLTLMVSVGDAGAPISFPMSYCVQGSSLRLAFTSGGAQLVSNYARK